VRCGQTTIEAKKKKKRTMGQEIQPLRLALRYVPAALIVEYTIGSNKSLYHHEIDFNHLTSTKQVSYY
jgi:hypothetical protein